MGNARMERGRIPPESFDQPPYNCVGVVSTNENSGTGFLISFNLVLTAAHIVWNFIENTKKKDIQFKWGNPLSVYEIENIIILQSKYRSAGRDILADDVILLKLKKDVPIKSFLDLGFGPKNNLLNTILQSLVLFGYTRQMKPSGFLIHKQDFDLFVKIIPGWGSIEHDLNMQKEQSGSPIIAKIEKNQFIIGMHTDSPVNQRNLDPLFSDFTLKRLRQLQWRLTSDDFTFFNMSPNPRCEPDWNCLDDFDIVDKTITRTNYKDRQGQLIRSFSKIDQYQKEKNLYIRFEDLKYGRNESVVSFGVELVFKDGSEDKVTFTNRKDTNRSTGTIKGGNKESRYEQSKEMFVKEGEDVELTLSLQKREVTFKKNRDNQEQQAEKETNLQFSYKMLSQTAVSDIFIFVEMIFWGDRLKISQNPDKKKASVVQSDMIQFSGLRQPQPNSLETQESEKQPASVVQSSESQIFGKQFKKLSGQYKMIAPL